MKTDVVAHASNDITTNVTQIELKRRQFVSLFSSYTNVSQTISDPLSTHLGRPMKQNSVLHSMCCIFVEGVNLYCVAILANMLNIF